MSKKKPVKKKPPVSEAPFHASQSTINGELLKSALGAAVPLWIEQLRPLGREAIFARVKELQAAEIRDGMPLIGAEELLFRGSKPGDSARAFNAVAEALACLSFCPGGVRAFGGHWDATKFMGTGEPFNGKDKEGSEEVSHA